MWCIVYVKVDLIVYGGVRRARQGGWFCSMHGPDRHPKLSRVICDIFLGVEWVSDRTVQEFTIRYLAGLHEVRSRILLSSICFITALGGLLSNKWMLQRSYHQGAR